MAKSKTSKRTRHLEGEVKRLLAENKRLKKQPVDKDELEYDLDGNSVDEKVIPCSFCKLGFMSVINIIDRQFYKCGSCSRTRKV